MFFLARQNSPKNQALQKLLFGTILLISGMSSVNFFSIFVHFGSLPGLFWQVFSGFNFDIEFQAFLDAKNLKTNRKDTDKLISKLYRTGWQVDPA